MHIAFRPILVIPHLIALFFVLIAWVAISIVAWFAILFTGRYPASLYAIAAGALQWLLRVEAYLLLLVDEYRRSLWRSIQWPTTGPCVSRTTAPTTRPHHFMRDDRAARWPPA